MRRIRGRDGGRGVLREERPRPGDRVRDAPGLETLREEDEDGASYPGDDG